MSSKKYERSLFVFRRDLRTHDNTALNNALKLSSEVIACFIFDPHQVEHNSYKSDKAIHYMIEALYSLEETMHEKGGRLHVFYGKPEQVIEGLHKEFKCDALFINKDYTPYARTRDAHLERIAEKHEMDFYACADVLLHEPEETLKANDAPYSVFTPFFRNASNLTVVEPHALASGKFVTHKSKNAYSLADIEKKIGLLRFQNLAYSAQHKNVAHDLATIKNQKDYDLTRDFPANEKGTAHLSAHLKFGTLSVREVYHRVKKDLGFNHSLIRQLYWRDFYYMIAYFTPEVFGETFVEKYRGLQWSTDTVLFNAWCAGKTGFPIVDAGMRQLNETGFMHNRVRMIVASFLTKDLHIDWRMGEKYFAQKLVDYDPCLNNGNWQWAASVGCDAQPYFRIFNPWLQQKKFDPECEYIKKWVPELVDYEAKKLHNPDYVAGIAKYKKIGIDHSIESAKAKKQFESYLKG